MALWLKVPTLTLKPTVLQAIELMSAIYSAALSKSTWHVCLLDETWHIRLFLNFYYNFYFSITDWHTAHQLSYFSFILPISVNIGLIISFFIFILTYWYLECNCDTTSSYIQSILTSLNELQLFFNFLSPFFLLTNKY